jgi:putative inorganic carbon (HCO3(-)) transporter
VKHYGRFTLAALVWGVLTFGAVYPWAYWPLVSACAVLGFIGLWTEDAPAAWQRWLALTLAVIGLGAVFQLVPLPRNVLLAIGPATDRFLQEYILGYASNPPPSHPLSVDPQQTMRALALFTGFSVFLLGLIRRIPYISIENLVRRLAIFAGALAVFAVVQRAVSGSDGTELVYGFWKPNGPGTIFGPFINRNHYAGWMIMGAPLALGFALGHVDRAGPKGRGWASWSRWFGSPEGSRFILPTLAALAMGASIAISGSRSGMASFALVILIAAIFAWRTLFHRARGAWIMAVAAAALVLAVFSWAGLEAAVNRFTTASEDAGSRMGAWRDTTRIIRDFPIFGVGLNAYGTAMLIYQSGDRRLFYKEAHNDYLQILAEGGLLFGIPAALAIAIVVVQIRQRFSEGRDPPMTRGIRAGAVAGLAGIAAQSLMEFSLQMPGNTALFLVLVALAVHRPLRSVRSLAERQRAA